MSRSRNKNLDFEINLLPFISILAVCISLLLITAVWIRTGSIGVKQALGTEESKDNSKESSLWVYFEDNGTTQLTVKNSSRVSRVLQAVSVPPINSQKVDVNRISSLIAMIKKSDPTLHTALVLPAASSVYEDVVTVMDYLKRSEIKDVGIAPL